MLEMEFDTAQATRRQEEIYAAADSEIWRRAVYDPLHGGWPLACIGGRPFLEYVARDAQLGQGDQALELGCGAGAACDFLAQISGAMVTGIERNPAQYDRARLRCARTPLLSFLCADAATWRATQPDMGAVFLLDTLSLVADWPQLLSAARSALALGKPLYIADQQAGPALRRATLQRAYEIDGFVGLRPGQELRLALQNAGFSEVTTRDANADAIRVFSGIRENVQGMMHEPGSPEEADALAQWDALTDFYLGAFKSRELVYTWTRAI